MLLLFNKTIKPLNQLAKKNPKEVYVFGATAHDFFTIFDKIFSQNLFFCYTQVFIPLATNVPII